MPAEPHGAALIVMPLVGTRLGRSGWLGRNGARCARTPIGPTPGPPPPCGMQNVLCRLRCDTSAPNLPGRATPTSALRFAPSRYTCPPCSCTRAQISRIAPRTRRASTGTSPSARASCRRASTALASRSSRSTLPLLVARHDHDPHARHRGRRRVGAVRRRGDQADVAAGFAARHVVLADREQPRVLTLRTGVRLQRHRVVAGDLGEPALEVVERARGSRRPGRAARTGGCARTRAT